MADANEDTAKAGPLGETSTAGQPKKDCGGAGAPPAAAAVARQPKKPNRIFRSLPAIWGKLKADPVASATFALAGATAWLAFVASKTDEATHELAKASSEQVKIIQQQLDVMNTAREQTEKLIKAAQDSADVARRALAIGQRPWVYPELAITDNAPLFSNASMSLKGKAHPAQRWQKPGHQCQLLRTCGNEKLVGGNSNFQVFCRSHGTKCESASHLLRAEFAKARRTR